MPGIALGALVCVAAIGADPEEIFPISSSGTVPVPYAARPLIQPHRTYEIFVEAPVQNVDSRGPTPGLTAGARHGFSEDFELGIILFPLIFYQGVDIQEPTMFGTYRFVSGVFELGAYTAATFPIGGAGTWVGEGALPMLLHGGDVFRLDFGPHALFSTDVGHEKRFFVPVRATIQIAPQFRIAVVTGAEVSITSNPLVTAFRVPAGGESFYTITGPLGAGVDLGATFTFSTLYDTSADRVLSAHHWVALAAARFYVKGEVNPLDEPF
jgi:hypothetical protein